MTAELDSLQTEFLKSHRLGVLATSRRSGAPQVSIIAYNYDGTDVVISTRDQSAKYRNVSKRPSVALIVTDGGKAVTVYGTATITEGDEAAKIREERLQQRRAAGAPERPGNPGDRVILRFVPESVFSNRLDE
jgi:PPOX class probable F420-dependent enzyme